ncbi:tumor necrosis factor receptor superfamily member 3 [Nerophis ophidion]|uniref:tumor necrosis factor receptor superfamily member 3 n=1 Tax=Nerophis ophidion TaxID=159077 RepID=UPI002ADFDC31|nr:tumor necrosis factor receptor superfamily member 3 [Nerophis ophidion]
MGLCSLRMGLKVHYLVSVLLSSAQLLLTLPLTEENHPQKMCRMCPPGKFQKSCNQCEPCPRLSYTADWNREDDCHRCYGDCRPEFNQKVIKNCSSTSNLKCACQAGFGCTSLVPHSENCKNCVKISDVTTLATTKAPLTTTTTTKVTVTSDEHEQTPSPSSSEDDSISARLCSSPECDRLSGNSSPVKEEKRGTDQLAGIVCLVVVMVTATLVILFCICQPGEETCLKRAVMNLYNKGGGDAAEKKKEEHFPANPCGAVHVHNAGTVIFSWLSHFTGQVGPVMEARRLAEEEQEDQTPSTLLTPPTTSPSVPLSEEERSGKATEVFFPSQEEGKEWHVSKEEGF